MDNVNKVLEYVNGQEIYYNSRLKVYDDTRTNPDEVAKVMVDIIENFRKDKNESLTTGDLEHGWFRSLEANFVRHPKSYRACTDIDLENNLELDLEVSKTLVMFFRDVAKIQRGEKL